MPQAPTPARAQRGLILPALLILLGLGDRKSVV